MYVVVILKRNARLKMKRNVTMGVEGRDERRGGETVDQKGKNKDYILGKRIEEVEEFQYRLCFCWLQDRRKPSWGGKVTITTIFYWRLGLNMLTL